MAELSTYRRRRGVARASITRLGTRLKDLEDNAIQPTTLNVAQRMAQKLETLDSDFKSRHYSVIDLIEEDGLEREQYILDEHDDEVTGLSTRLQQLITNCSTHPDPANSHKIVSRRLVRLQKNLASINESVDALPVHASFIRPTCV